MGSEVVVTGDGLPELPQELARKAEAYTASGTGGEYLEGLQICLGGI